MTPEDVRRARVLLGDGKTLTQVARIFGVTTQAIYRLKTGRTWRNIK